MAPTTTRSSPRCRSSTADRARPRDRDAPDARVFVTRVIEPFIDNEHHQEEGPFSLPRGDASTSGVGSIEKRTLTPRARLTLSTVARVAKDAIMSRLVNRVSALNVDILEPAVRRVPPKVDAESQVW